MVATDLWGNPIDDIEDAPAEAKRKKRQNEPAFWTYCYKCGKRVRGENAIPVAFHTDYCRKCYEIWTRGAAGLPE